MTDLKEATKATGTMGDLTAGHGLESAEEAAVRNAKERDESKARKADLVSNKKEIEQAKKEKQKANTGEEKKRASAVIAALREHRKDILNRTGKQEEAVKQPVGPMQMGVPEPVPNNQLRPANQDESPGGTSHPFKLSAFIPEGKTDTEYSIKVKYGMVNTTEPQGMGGGTNKKIPNVTGDKGVVYLKLLLDANDDISEATIGEIEEMPEDVIDPNTGQITKAYIRLGTYKVTKVRDSRIMSISQVVTGSLWFTVCGRTINWNRI